MKKRNTSFKELLREFQELDRQLSEPNMYGQEDMPMGGDDMGYEEDGYYEGEGGEDVQKGDSAEEQAMHAIEVIKHEPIIGKIRETAIEGLRKYADSPTSPIYEFLKKVFLEADKVLTDTGKK